MLDRCLSGHTLVELLIVCAVLAVVAKIALPSAQPVAEFRLDAAAGEVAQALRFTRQEAMRTNAYRMLGCNLAQNQVQVYIPAFDGSGSGTGAVSALLKHPLSKMDYTINLARAPAGGNVALASCTFQFADKSSAATLAFDANGYPIRGTGKAADQVQALTAATLIVGSGKNMRKIAVDANGRVTTA